MVTTEYHTLKYQKLWYCGTCHMAYILIFSIFLPSLNNNTIFIYFSYFIKHTLALFFKFLCICATESLPGIYKPPELSQIIQSTTCSCPDNTSSRLVSTSPLPAGCFWIPMSRWEEAIPVVCLASDHRLPDRQSALPCSVRATKRHSYWSQVSLALLCPCHQEAPDLDRKSASPSKGFHRLHLGLVQLLYATSWYCHQELLYATSWYSHEQLLYTTSWYCHHELLYATSWYSHEQLLYATSWYCHPQFLYATSWYCNQ